MTKQEYAIKVLNDIKHHYQLQAQGFQMSLDMAIKALQQEDVLDKIRGEILDEAEYAYADFDQYKEDILHAEPDELPDDDFRYGLERAVEILNKY